MARVPDRSSGQAGVQAFIAELARVLLTRLPKMTKRGVEEIVRGEPAYGSGLVSRDDLWRSVHDNMQRHLESIIDLDTGVIEGARRRVDAARATGTRRAEQSFPLEVMLHAFRIGGRVIWESFVEEARSRGLGGSENLLDGATIVWDVVDVQSAAVADAYRQTEVAILRRSEVRAQALFDALIDDAIEASNAAPEASAALDLPEHGRYLVIVAEVGTEGRGVLERPADAFSAAGLPSAWRLRPRREIGLVHLGDAAVAVALEVVHAMARSRIGIGPLADGLAKVAGAHALAETALATVPPGQHGVAVLEERLEASLVIRSPDLAARLRDRVLGPLDNLPEQERLTLLETLSAYLDSGASAAKTGASLFCHRNTVLNRIKRLESLTGRSLSHPRDVGALLLALEAERLLT